ncbi:MAG: Veg family protein [Bacilli bacterium]
MTIEKIKNNIDSKLGDNVKIVYNGSRNKKEEYSGVITETYNYIFIVKVGSDEIKSFSYRDILTNTVEIFFDKM